MAIPQRLTVVTIGAHAMAELRAFYMNIGWDENEGSDDSFASFTVGSVRLALYPFELLGEEAAPGEPAAMSNSWNGTTMTVNVASSEEVDDSIETAAAAGATPIGTPSERQWGGYSGYFSDPEGHRWEVAWAPWLSGCE